MSIGVFEYYLDSMLPVSNKIERIAVLPATPDVVWEKSFSSPEAMMSWFPDKLEGELVEGKNFFLIWEQHRCECRMIVFKKAECLEFKWHPGVSVELTGFPEEELTTVTFTFEKAQTKSGQPGTKVTMIETGFAKVGKKRRQAVFEANNGGWNIEMAKLPKGY